MRALVGIYDVVANVRIGTLGSGLMGGKLGTLFARADMHVGDDETGIVGMWSGIAATTQR